MTYPDGGGYIPFTQIGFPVKCISAVKITDEGGDPNVDQIKSFGFAGILGLEGR